MRRRRAGKSATAWTTPSSPARWPSCRRSGPRGTHDCSGSSGSPRRSSAPGRRAEMVDILHRIGVQGATPDKVYDALTTVDGLSGWWTEDVHGKEEVGGVLEFRFPPVGGFDMEVVERRPAERVVWRVVDGPEEWIGTTIEWDLRQEGDYAIVLFSHRGWREPV